MEWLLAIISILFLITGIIGCILPVLPGPPLSFAGMLIMHFTRFAEFETSTLIIVGTVIGVVQILDYIVPVLGTKKFGGTKYGANGSIVGLLIGMFFLPPLGPFGIITVLGGPFLGAYIGEIIGGAKKEKALGAAFGTFVGFLAGTLIRVITSVTITVMVITKIIQAH
jgi:uncharacterized protein YqgC (DUF456 family)